MAVPLEHAKRNALRAFVKNAILKTLEEAPDSYSITCLKADNEEEFAYSPEAIEEQGGVRRSKEAIIQAVSKEGKTELYEFFGYHPEGSDLTLSKIEVLSEADKDSTRSYSTNAARLKQALKWSGDEPILRRLFGDIPIDKLLKEIGR